MFINQLCQRLFLQAQFRFSFIQKSIVSLVFHTVFRLNLLKRRLNAYPDAKAVLVINPTYFGFAADLKRIVEIAHAVIFLLL